MNSSMRISVLLIALLFSLSLMGQTFRQQPQEKEGSIQIHKSALIDSLLKDHKAINEKFPEIDGYRVMLFFDAGNNSKDSAYSVISNFEEDYPEVPAYLSFNPPYYRVRVGDFRTEIEAERFLNRIKYDYPNGWVVQTEIELPKLD
ncbi:MAG: SPOR domain-containing protein [Bacteroidota bacterium]